MSLVGSAARFTPWARVIALGEIALTAKRHLDRLDPGEGTELRGLLVKSKGRPANLTKDERSRLLALVKKLEPGAFARNAASTAMPLRRRRP